MHLLYIPIHFPTYIKCVCYQSNMQHAAYHTKHKPYDPISSPYINHTKKVRDHKLYLLTLLVMKLSILNGPFIIWKSLIMFN